MIRVVLPAHLRTLARVHGEVELDVAGQVTQRSVLDALEARYPLASTLVRRAMIDFSLQSARFKRYPHAARHLAECAALAPRIADFGTHPTHDDYRRRLRLDHGRKAAFWQSVQALA